MCAVRFVIVLELEVIILAFCFVEDFVFLWEERCAGVEKSLEASQRY